MVEQKSTQKKVLTYVFWGALIIAIGFALWYFVFRDKTKCDPYRPGFDTDGKPTDKCKAEKASTTKTKPSDASPGFTWKDESFPLEKGMIGLKIKALQQALGIKDDSKFWTQTEDAVKIKFNGKTKVSQSDYETLFPISTTPTTPAPSTQPPVINNNDIGKKVYAKSQIVHIRSTPDVNDGFINNKVCELALNLEPAPTIIDVKDCTSGIGCKVANPYIWYKIQFEIANCTSKTGWVRQDVVTIK